jgi:hypothetical protein
MCLKEAFLFVVKQYHACVSGGNHPQGTFEQSFNDTIRVKTA